MNDETTTYVKLINGPYGGLFTELSETPLFINIKGLLYERIEDPDTGEFLGGYAITEPAMWVTTT